MSAQGGQWWGGGQAPGCPFSSCAFHLAADSAERGCELTRVPRASPEEGKKPPETAGGMVLLQKTASLTGELLSCLHPRLPSPSASQFLSSRAGCAAGSGCGAAELPRVQQTREAQNWQTRAGGGSSFVKERLF